MLPSRIGMTRRKSNIITENILLDLERFSRQIVVCRDVKTRRRKQLVADSGGFEISVSDANRALSIPRLWDSTSLRNTMGSFTRFITVLYSLIENENCVVSDFYVFQF